ncbi:DAGLA.2 family protein [Megaselia abdita]
MPGLVVYKRRWLVGSDDLILPAIVLITFQVFCIILLTVALSIHNHDTSQTDSLLLFYFGISYTVILLASIITELGICGVSLRGTILDIEARARVRYYLYVKTLLIIIDTTWLILGVVWLAVYHPTFANTTVKELVLSTVICGWVLFIITMLMIYFTYDGYGRSWVNGNWREAHYERKYHKSWEQRCRFWFCCVASPKRNQITDISRIISDFFMELDVVPSDIAAGFLLLRNFQKLEREEAIRHNPETGITKFLSGVPVRDTTLYITPNDASLLEKAVHYMHFANGAYGWPVYVVGNQCGLAKIMPAICCCCCRPQDSSDIIFDDNFCGCNYTALQKTLKLMDVDIIYVTYHCDIGETPFFVAIDYNYKKIVISIRGTLSMEDILTDLNGENEVLPLNESREDWLCHRGMLHAALYIKEKLADQKLIEKALERDPSRQTDTYDLVVVGHSLGAGTASILGILLKETYPSLECFCFSPPGGLLSLPVVEYTKTFTTSVIVGEDVIPRLGLRQLENLRADLIHVLKESEDPKWKTLSCCLLRCCCCCCRPHQMPNHNIEDYKEQKMNARLAIDHTLDNERVLSLHHPLYPPGRIIHIGKDDPDSDELVYSIYTLRYCFDF